MNVFEDILDDVLVKFEKMFDEIVEVIDIKTVLREGVENQYDILNQLDKSYQHLDKIRNLIKRK